MASEAQITTGLTIQKDNLFYISQPTSYSADVATGKGPTPGAISVSILGTDVDLSQLVQPGLCRIQNLDETNWVEYGIWDEDNSQFFPLGELLPGEQSVLRLARNLAEEFGEANTGTGGAGNNKLRFRANTATCFVIVDAFET